MPKTIQETIHSVHGVNCCKIQEDQGQITQVFVEATLAAEDDEARTQEIKGVVRSIIGAVSIHHNIELDYRKIKVIDYKLENQHGSIQLRIQLIAAYLKRYVAPECVVELCYLDKHYIGTAPLGNDLGLSTFDAFLHAFHQMEFGTVKLVYLQLLNNALAQEKVVLLKMKYTHRDQTCDTLLGVAEVTEDLASAVAKAALNAINRRTLAILS